MGYADAARGQKDFDNMKFSYDLSFARHLDTQDELAAYRQHFVIDDPNLIYLDGNSLGRLPKATLPAMQDAIERQWGQRLIRSWNDSWVAKPAELGAKIAQLIGARPDEVLVCESTSTNLFKLATAAVRARPNHRKIISDVFNFPSDLYILQGIIDLLGGQHRLDLIPSRDNISIHPEDVAAAIDDDTALVALTHVAFKSAFLYDMRRVTEQAHQAGALMLWDLSHSVGAVPLDLNACGVDLAVGCTYKYLNGGPGAPAFLYVRKDLQKELSPPIWGWFAAARPFDFDLEFTAAEDIARFRIGTPPMLSMLALEPALEIIIEAGIARLRAKSVQQTEYALHLAQNWLRPLGFKTGSPGDAAHRGSHIALRHPDAFRICKALIEGDGLRVIPDFRAPDNIRLGITPLYTTYEEIYRALDRIREIVDRKMYNQYSSERQIVT